MSYQQLDTSPLAATKYGTRHGGAEEGSGTRSIAARRKTLTQYRAAIVEDMAHKAICYETEDFLDEFFPLCAGVSKDDHPEWQYDLFKDLEDARHMCEAEVSEAFVSTYLTTPPFPAAYRPSDQGSQHGGPYTQVDARRVAKPS